MAYSLSIHLIIYPSHHLSISSSIHLIIHPSHHLSISSSSIHLIIYPSHHLSTSSSSIHLIIRLQLFSAIHALLILMLHRYAVSNKQSHCSPIHSLNDDNIVRTPQSHRHEGQRVLSRYYYCCCFCAHLSSPPLYSSTKTPIIR